MWQRKQKILLDHAERELHRACQIIFGSELKISNHFLNRLQWSGVKTAYRKRAFETHPDRVARFGEKAQQRNADMFKTVQEAYESLTSYIEARDKGYRLRPTPLSSIFRKKSPSKPAYSSRGMWHSQRNYTTPQSTSQRKPSVKVASQPPQKRSKSDIDSLYQGPIPKRKLMLGHFMYYSGIINWRMVVQALSWQKRQRPRLGEIGQRMGILNEYDIKRILKIRTTRQPFGKSAIKLGLLNESQLRTLISRQKCIQKKFGQYFVENNFLRPAQLDILLKKFRKHNAVVSSPYIFKF